MDNFIFQNSTKIYFGKDAINNLSLEAKNLGKKVLLVYGGGSIKKNGIYQAVINELNKAKVGIIELSGVEANPHLETVIKGANLCKENNIDFILAVGGGSTIDCSKAISAASNYNGNPWDFFTGKTDAKTIKMLPLIAVLTLSATGSEMNSGAVITNEKTNEKYGAGFQNPKISFLDPTYTFTVSKWQTACGTADITSHIMEQYFGGEKPSFLQDQLAISLFKTCLKYGPIACKEPNNYEARANLMWASSLALNRLLSAGHNYPWVAHPLEHPLSGIFNITHGAGLAILTPNILTYVLNEKTAPRIAYFFKESFEIKEDLNDIEISKLGIKMLKDYYLEMGINSKLSELNIDSNKFEECVDQVLGNDKYLDSGFVKLNRNDIISIYKMAY